MGAPEDTEILLVEDNAEDAEMTLWALEKHRLRQRVHHVTDGEEALEAIFSTGRYCGHPAPPDPRLVLLDLKLPKVDGFEVLRRIRSDRRTLLVPVVIMTSSAEDRDMVESYKLGVNSYIVKPVDSEKFRDTVQQLGLYWLLLNRVPPSGVGV